MANCPICNEKLSIEMLPIGTNPGEKKKRLKIGAILPQVITWAIDESLRATVCSGRTLYLTCNNAECPACWKANHPIYFKNGILGPSLVGDSLGLRLTIMRGQYTKRKRARERR